MAIDISNEPETLNIKAKYTGMGLSPTLADALIAEANREYNTTIGYEDYSNYAMLTINLTDNDENDDGLYIYTVLNGDMLLRGFQTLSQSHIFGQLPLAALTVQVYKVKSDLSTIYAYGFQEVSLGKDTEITLTLNPISISEEIGWIHNYIEYMSPYTTGTLSVGRIVKDTWYHVGHFNLSEASKIEIILKVYYDASHLVSHSSSDFHLKVDNTEVTITTGGGGDLMGYYAFFANIASLLSSGQHEVYCLINQHDCYFGHIELLTRRY